MKPDVAGTAHTLGPHKTGSGDLYSPEFRNSKSLAIILLTTFIFINIMEEIL
jgi:hypothetical protein